MPKYRCVSTEPALDGSGNVNFDIYAEDDLGYLVPGKHKTIAVPYDELAAALDLPTDPQIIAAVKNLLQQYAGPGWQPTELSTYIAMNENATQADSDLDDFVNDHGGYPATFNL